MSGLMNRLTTVKARLDWVLSSISEPVAKPQEKTLCPLGKLSNRACLIA